MEVTIPQSILHEFQKHTDRLRDASNARKNAVALKNVVEDKQDRETMKVADTLGRRQPSDVYDGDVNLRTLRTLLKMTDESGWERYVPPEPSVNPPIFIPELLAACFRLCCSALNIK